MTRVEQVHNDIWHDPPFCDLAAPAKLAYLWSWTNPLCPMSGLYKVRPVQIELDTGLPAETIARALAELEAHGMVRYEHGVLWCCARVRRLGRGRSAGIARSVARDVAALAATDPLRIAFLERYAAESWLRDELRPLLAESLPEACSEAPEGLPGFPVVEGETDSLSGASPEAPMQLHMQGSSRTEENARRAREAEDEVWAHYLATFHPDGRGPLPTFDEKRRSVVAAALAVRDIAHCKRAITGLSRSPHHRGENEQGVRYTDIRYALRGNGQRAETHEERIDRMAALADGRPPRPGERGILSVTALLAAEKEQQR